MVALFNLGKAVTGVRVETRWVIAVAPALRLGVGEQRGQPPALFHVLARRLVFERDEHIGLDDGGNVEGRKRKFCQTTARGDALGCPCVLIGGEPHLQRRSESLAHRRRTGLASGRRESSARAKADAVSFKRLSRHFRRDIGEGASPCEVNAGLPFLDKRFRSRYW